VSSSNKKESTNFRNPLISCVNFSFWLWKITGMAGNGFALME